MDQSKVFLVFVLKTCNKPIEHTKKHRYHAKTQFTTFGLKMSTALATNNRNSNLVSHTPNLIEEKDSFGNCIMTLNEIGLDAVVRYKRYEDGVRLAQIDVVKAVTGKSMDYSTQILRRMSEEVNTEVRAKCTNVKFKGICKSTLLNYLSLLKFSYI